MHIDRSKTPVGLREILLLPLLRDELLAHKARIQDLCERVLAEKLPAD